MTGLDIASFEADSGGEWMTILHPATREPIESDDGQQAGIRLVGQDSEEFRKASRKNTDRRLRSRQKGTKITAEELEQDAIDLLVACTKEWRGIYRNGTPLPYSLENARMLYSTVPFIREQVDEFAGDRANFFRS